MHKTESTTSTGMPCHAMPCPNKHPWYSSIQEGRARQTLSSFVLRWGTRADSTDRSIDRFIHPSILAGFAKSERQDRDQKLSQEIQGMAISYRAVKLASAQTTPFPPSRPVLRDNQFLSIESARRGGGGKRGGGTVDATALRLMYRYVRTGCNQVSMHSIAQHSTRARACGRTTSRRVEAPAP